MIRIRTKLLITVGVFAVAFAVFGFLWTWFLIRKHTQDFTASQAQLALDFDLAIRKYIGDTIRPLMEQRVGKGEFIPEAMSSSFVAREMFEEVRKEFPDYVIKFSSDRPRNPANVAGPEEIKIIEYFRENPEATKWAGAITMNGKEYFVQCIPRQMKESCLGCHGRPEDAPATLLARYGSTAGFYRSVGDVAAIDVVGVPTDKVRGMIVSEARTQLVVLATGVAVLVGVFLLVFRLLIGSRLEAITEHFKNAAAQPEGVTLTPIEVVGNDEISLLASNFNFLAARSRDVHDCLERRVQERTAKLEAEIAERRHAAEALRASEERFRRFAMASGYGLWMGDLNGRALFANAATLKILEEECVEDFVDKRFYDYYPPEDAERVRKEILPIVVEKGQWVGELQVRTAKGNLKPTQQVIFLIRDEQGTPRMVGNIITDITERKDAEGRLRESMERLELYAEALESSNLALEQSNLALEESNRLAKAGTRAKSEFLANMSHEIRTPMTAILGYTDLLLLTEGIDKVPGDWRYSLDAIKRNGEHLLGVINGILDLSKVESGKMEVEPIRCSPVELVTEVVALMRVRAEAKQLRLATELVGPLPETIRTDPLRLRQVLINLVGNAIKFTDQGEVRISVRLTHDTGTPRLRFDVTDTGIGMKEEQMQRIFQPFGQADSSTTRKFGGTGLGLCISKRLAEALGGTIEASSVYGQGSTFRITIDPGPLDGIRVAEQHWETAIQPPPIVAPVTAGTIALHCRVLLAEDGPDNQRLISLLLKRAGAEVNHGRQRTDCR